MTWTVDDSGTKTATGSGTEDTLATSTMNATYVLAVDLVNMVNGDVTTLLVYDRVDGTNYRVAWRATFAHVQNAPAVQSPPLAVSSAAKFSLTQSAGTGRNYPWVVRRI